MRIPAQLRQRPARVLREVVRQAQTPTDRGGPPSFLRQGIFCSLVDDTFNGVGNESRFGVFDPLPFG